MEEENLSTRYERDLQKILNAILFTKFLVLLNIVIVHKKYVIHLMGLLMLFLNDLISISNDLVSI